MNRVTVNDIAKKAGVSSTAVSFALNGKPGIGDETRAKILQAIDELGYPPAIRGRKKTFGAEKTILLLSCSRTAITANIFAKTPYFSELLRAFENKLSAEGYHFYVRSICVDENYEQNIRAILNGRNIDIILLIATDMLEKDYLCIRNIERNIIVLDTDFSNIEANCVVIDNYLGGVLAAKHLIQSGHTHIGYVQSDIRIYNFEYRKKGFFDEITRNGLVIQEKHILNVTPDLESKGVVIKYLENEKDLPTCYFAENDYMAIGMLQALKGMKIAVPDRVSIIGFDNIDMAGIVSPGLTTINVPKGKLAELCINQIQFLLSNQEISCGVKSFVAVDLIDRHTTKKF